MNISTIIFDLDGTLIDTAHARRDYGFVAADKDGQHFNSHASCEA